MYRKNNIIPVKSFSNILHEDTKSKALFVEFLKTRTDSLLHMLLFYNKFWFAVFRQIPLLNLPIILHEALILMQTRH